MKYILCIFFLILFAFEATMVSAQVPHVISYQGRLTVGGTNLDGAAQFKFALVSGIGSTNFWSNDGSKVGQPNAGVSLPLIRGLYSVLLGDTTLAGMAEAIPPSVFTNSDVRLRVWVNDGSNGFQQLLPDQRIAAVGYALVAAGLDPGADVRAQRLIVGSGQNLSGAGSTISGGSANSALSDYAAIGGGLTNAASGFGAVVAGGQMNAAIGVLTLIGGGYGNLASNIESVVVGGALNISSGTNSFVGGGYANVAGATEATVAGGESNTAAGIISSVGGGYANQASGYAATIPGGFANLASGAYSFAAGAGAAATNYGAFVWADASSTNAFISSNNNEFSARASGGFRFLANSAGTVGVRLAPGANAWSPASDRSLKENSSPVDRRAILARLVAMPVTEWNLVSQDPSIRHIGPMAQDFKTSFGVGEDDRHISTTDADGVAFAAIQALHEMVKEKEARIVELEKRLNGIESAIQQLGRTPEHKTESSSASRVK